MANVKRTLLFAICDTAIATANEAIQPSASLEYTVMNEK